MVASGPSELMILRHAEAVAAEDGGDDASRPLTARGRNDAHAQGLWLESIGWRPDLLLVSPARRALQTATLVLEAVPGPQPTCRGQRSLYLAPLPRLLTALGELPSEAGRVLLVGHNPGLHALIESLTGQPLSLGPLGRVLPTATLIALSLPAGFSALTPGCGGLARWHAAAGAEER